MERKKEMQESVDRMAKALFGRTQKSGTCVSCGTDKMNDEDFVDELSRRESKISFLCQKCQDVAFADPEDE